MTFVMKGKANMAGAVAEMADWNSVWPGLSCESSQVM